MKGALRLHLALLTVASIFAAPVARADYYRREERIRYEDEMRRREFERRRWMMEHREYHEVVAPATVVYTAPPPSPGLSIVLPINIH